MITQIVERYFCTNKDKIDIRKCSMGDVNFTYIAKHGGTAVFVKIQDNPQLYDKQIEREFAGLEICKQQGIPYPSVLQYTPGDCYVITEYMDFPLLSNVWQDINAEPRAAMKQEVLKLVARRNSVHSAQFGATCGGTAIG